MKQNIRLIYLFNFLLDFRLYGPLAVLYFASIAGSFALAMSIFSVIYLSQAFLEVPTGVVSDYIGRKKTLIVGSFFSFLSVVLYAFGMNFWILAAGALFEGLSRALFSGTSSALLYESLKEEGQEARYHDVLGKTSAMFQWALGVSATLGGFVAFHSMAMAVWLSVIPRFLCFVLCWWFEEPKCVVRTQESLIHTLRNAVVAFKCNWKLRLISLADIVSFSFGEAAHELQAAFYKMLVPVWAIGFIRTCSNVFAGLSFWFSGTIIDRLGHGRSLMCGSLYFTVVGFVALIFPTPFSPWLMTTTSLAFGVSMTARGDLMNQEFTDKQRATMGSVVSLAGSICYALVAVGLGYIADLTSPIIALLVALSSNIFVIYVYWILFRKKV